MVCDVRSPQESRAPSCGSWCTAVFAATHCPWCKCAGCPFCGDHAAPTNSEDRSFPSAAGRWDCNVTPPTYHDAAGPSTSAQLGFAALRPLMGKWTVLIGDSSMRILFHLLLGVLTMKWTRWPPELSALGHGPDGQPKSCLETHATSGGSCLEDAYHKGLRLTCVWTEYGDDGAQLESLRRVANDTLGAPDVLVVGFGAWWAWHRPSEAKPCMACASEKA